MERGYNVK
jgi:hypothetical protein